VTAGIFLCEDKHRAFAVYKAFVPILGLTYFTGKIIAAKDFKIVKCAIFTVAMSVFIVSIAGFSEILFKKSAVFFMKDNPYFKIHPIGERMMSTLLHPSVLGSYFVITLPACLFVTENGNKSISKIAWSAVFVLGVLALFFTFSRGRGLAPRFLFLFIAGRSIEKYYCF
jgi:hypothetical protein